MLSYQSKGAELTVRKAHEGWPLLSEQPLEGGNTSRFVDTSMERLELLANRAFCTQCEVQIEGRPLELTCDGSRQSLSGIRYRRTALYPSLHPGIAPQMPLHLAIRQKGNTSVYRLPLERRRFEPCSEADAPPGNGAPCKKLHPDLVTCDLRIA
jgi:uncharacterized protein (DUF2126 family)